MAKVSIKDVIYFLADLWNQITSKTIHNCWAHVEIMNVELLLSPPNNIENDIYTNITYLINRVGNGVNGVSMELQILPVKVI